jgi:uncharacterized protein
MPPGIFGESSGPNDCNFVGMKRLREHIRFFAPLLLLSCGSDSVSQTMENDKTTNRLIHESSPYLLQHAHNPVDWFPWGDEAWEKAKAENKLVIISIGYSACHWCHVMERESFENKGVANIMNRHFVSIKVDREERPDIDQVYMTAVQLMTGSGGWPLNCVALPDGRPVYGGTYFQKTQWMDVLLQLSDMFENEPGRMEGYAAQLTDGLRQSDLIQTPATEKDFTPEMVVGLIEQWSHNWDRSMGGPNRAPKFPMPALYEFLLSYHWLNQDPEAEKHLLLTLEKMARGGIYDQLGGGFARYSVDADWKVPHFEKMLYDNAQLARLYFGAYALTGNDYFLRIANETTDWMLGEMQSKDGGFYSALDADSEGEEGKFYIWSEEELRKKLGSHAERAFEMFGIGALTRWEHGHHILHYPKTDEQLALKFGLSPEEWNAARVDIIAKLMAERNNRIRPGLDDKIITSWNAMTISALTKGYATTGNESYLKTALSTMDFLLKNQTAPDGGLLRIHKNGKATIAANLEDYAFVIEALIDLYVVTFDERFLKKADELTGYVEEHFSDENSGMFWFTSSGEPALVARMQELADNVIPSSNSAMATNLFRLGTLLDKPSQIDRSAQMLANVLRDVKYPEGLGRWSQLLMWHVGPFYEVAISGEDAHAFRKDMLRDLPPNAMLMGSNTESDLPLLKGKFIPGDTYIYVCVDKSCRLPVTSVSHALKQLNPSK